MKAKIRKLVTVVEETRVEMDRAVEPPTRRAAAVAVIENPFAGRYVEDLSPLIDVGEELGALLAARAVAALGIEGSSAESYGKAAAVGENGELEHAAALLHPKLGAPVRKVLGKGAALIPSSKKRGNSEKCVCTKQPSLLWATMRRTASRVMPLASGGAGASSSVGSLKVSGSGCARRFSSRVVVMTRRLTQRSQQRGSARWARCCR